MSISTSEFFLLNLWQGLPILVAGFGLQIILMAGRHGLRPLWLVVLRTGLVQTSALIASMVVWMRWPFSFDTGTWPWHLPLLFVEVFVLGWYLLWPRRLSN